MRIGGAAMKPYHTPEEWLAIQKELTASAVVFPVSSDDPVSLQDEYLQCIRENDLALGEVGVWRNVLDSDPEKRKANIDYAIAQLALADRVGANCCVNIAGSNGASSWDGYHPSNYSAETYELTVEVTRQIIDAVKPTRTRFALEPMPWMIPDSPEGYLRLIRDIDREALGVHLDYVNMINSIERYHNSTAFIRSCFELLGNRICSVHIKDMKLMDPVLTMYLSETVPGRGTIDLREVARCCEKLGPDTTCFTEHLDSHEEYMEAIAAFRKAGAEAGVTIL